VTPLRRRAPVAELHAADPIAAAVASPALWWCDPTDSAIVLGSRQQPQTVDVERCRALGLSVVRRRSGGGAVLVEPAAVAWCDLVLPHGVAPDDVRGSMVWAGERWRQALGALGVGPLLLHDGGMLCTPWSSLVCFAGTGPGELLDPGGRKLLGLSQRRSRHGVRIQGTVYRRPPSVDITTLFTDATPPAALPEIATADVDPAELATALAAAVG
jgi:lipoate-protein ligase A